MPEFKCFSCPFNNRPNTQCQSVCDCVQCKYMAALSGEVFDDHCKNCASIHCGGMCNFVQANYKEHVLWLNQTL